MKRQRLFLATFFTLVLTVGTLTRYGWFQARPERSSLPAVVNDHSFKSVQDPFASPSALRWRQGLPNHWRAFLLQR
jgi:hypothetical protein